jgi:hypothetical protein
MSMLCVLCSTKKQEWAIRAQGPRKKISQRRKQKISLGDGYLCLVECCQVEVSATGRSLVQRIPTDCGVSLCVIQ